MRGDILASGGRSAVFPSNSSVSQDKWDSIFGPKPLNILKKPAKKTGKTKKNEN